MSLLRAWWRLVPEEIPTDADRASKAPRPPARADEAAGENYDALIEQVSRTIVRLRLEVPAVMFLEIHRPIFFLASQGLFFCAPLLGLLLPPRKIDEFAHLLDSPQGVERLIERIEELATRNASQVPRSPFSVECKAQSGQRSTQNAERSHET